MKKCILASAAILLSLVVLTAAALKQQDKSQRPSPPAKAECKIRGSSLALTGVGGGPRVLVTVDYSSPRTNGRKIFGGLIPYGKVWRAGANEATTFVINTDVNVGDKTVPAGSYTLFTVPNQDKWTLIIRKKTGEWGVPYPGEANDLLRVDMKASTLPSAVENFTIAFDKSGAGCTMRMDWETTRASVDISEKK